MQRVDGSLAEQITFTGPGSLDAHDMEVGIFAQDHWEFGDRLAFDAGLRLSGQTLGKSDAVAPRLGFKYAPGKDNRTILRGGVGVFYSGLPLMAGSFTSNPTRVITLFDTQGNPQGSPETLQNVYALSRNRGTTRFFPRAGSGQHPLRCHLECGNRPRDPILALPFGSAISPAAPMICFSCDRTNCREPSRCFS